MSVPHLTSNSGRLWEADRDPTANETPFIERGNFWLNTVTNNLFDCVSDTPASLVWNRKATASSSRAFVPVIQGTTSAGVGTYNAQVGRYQIINEVVFTIINIQWSAHTGTGNLRISGLPFIPYSAAVQLNLVNLQNIPLPLTSISPFVRNNNQFLDVYTLLAEGIEAAVVLPASGLLQFSGLFFL